MLIENVLRCIPRFALLLFQLLIFLDGKVFVPSKRIDGISRPSS